MSDSAEISNEQEVITLASGCFWCTEAVFKRVNGIISAVSGYSGGSVDNPSYDQVCSGRTGHAEAVQIKFDPNVISLEQFNTLLDLRIELFFNQILPFIFI